MTSPSIADEILAQIESHVRSVTDREVGGILIGDVGGGSPDETTIVAAIPALKAVAASANVTFTHEVWEEALPIVDRDYPGHKIVGWYHSHPDFGVFLSEYDLFIQDNFFPAPGMMALVLDPIRGDAGWFTTVDGKVEQTESFAIDAVESAAAVATREVASRNFSYSLVLIGAAALIAAFVIGWAVAPRGSSTAERASLAQAEQEASRANRRVSELENDLADARREGDSENLPTTTTTVLPPATVAPASEPGVETFYTVKGNDSMWRIAERFYGDGHEWTHIAEVNGRPSGNIEPGDRLLIPDLGGGPGSFQASLTDG